MRILFLFIFSFNLHAAQTAIIKASRALIYSDIHLKSPIGYLVRGKEILVGEQKRLNDKVLPTVIERKVVWIKVDDILLENDEKIIASTKTVKEHIAFIQSEELEEHEKDPLFENNYLRVKVGKVSPSIGQGEAGSGSGHSLTSEVLTGTEITAYFEHRHPLRRWNWGAGYQYSSFKSDLVKYTFPAIMVGAGYVFSKHKNFNLELLSHFLVSMDVRVDSIGVGVYQGSAYGFEFGPLVRYRAYKKTGIVLSALFKRVRYINLRSIQNNLNSRVDHLSTMNDFSIFAGLSFEL